jgi:sugar transferase (PEP-CTERM system associated)
MTVFGLETLLISGAIVAAALVHGSLPSASSAFWQIVLVTAVCEVCFYYNDLYDLTLVDAKRELLLRVVQGAGAAAMVLAVVTAVAPSLLLGSGILLTSLFLLVFAVPAWRLAFDGLTRDTTLRERVLILGTGTVARMLARQIHAQREFDYHVIGAVSERPDAERLAPHCPILGAAEDLRDIIQRYGIDRVVVSLADRRGSLPVQHLLDAKLTGIRVEDAATTYERITGKILIEGLKPSWLVFSDGFRASRATRLVKRAVDVTLAAAGLQLAAPLMVLTAIAVRLESKGPILYRQERVGENGRVFQLYKFRSMRVDAEAGTPVWARENDDRVTRVGRIIRATRLDELPQLWNVLRGDMSFVGPRPERPYFVAQLVAALPFYMARHAVKPGITGWAQVKYRYGSSVEDALEKLRYDLYYIKHLSIVFDLTIVADTVKVILTRKGAQ